MSIWNMKTDDFNNKLTLNIKQSPGEPNNHNPIMFYVFEVTIHLKNNFQRYIE